MAALMYTISDRDVSAMASNVVTGCIMRDLTILRAILLPSKRRA